MAQQAVTRKKTVLTPEYCTEFDEKKNKYHIDIILPDVKKEDVDLTVLAEGLMLKADRGDVDNQEGTEDDTEVVLQERELDAAVDIEPESEAEEEESEEEVEEESEEDESERIEEREEERESIHKEAKRRKRGATT